LSQRFRDQVSKPERVTIKCADRLKRSTVTELSLKVAQKEQKHKNGAKPKNRNYLDLEAGKGI